MTIPALCGPLRVTAGNKWIDYRIGLVLYSSQIAEGTYATIWDLTSAINAQTSPPPKGLYVYPTIVNNRIVVRFAVLGQTLQVLFGSGIHAAESVRDLVGYKHEDKTGSSSYDGDYQAQGCWVPERVPARDTGYWSPEVVGGKMKRSLSGAHCKRLIAGVRGSRELEFAECSPNIIYDDGSDGRKNRTLEKFVAEYLGSQIVYFPDRSSKIGGVSCWMDGLYDFADDVKRPHVDVETYDFKIKLLKKT